MKRITVLTILTAFLALWTVAVFGAVPQLINFQGILRDGSGNPVANGSYSVTFRIYDAPSAGNVLWSEVQSVTTNGGLFSIYLGSGPLPIADTTFNDSTRWLGIQVAGDPEMTPRQRLSSVGYSYVSSQWTSVAEDLFRLNGNVGIGTAPGFQTKLYVQISGSSSFLPIKGVQGTADNTSSGAAMGGYFSSGPSGTGYHYGAYGYAGTGSSASYGVYGEGTKGVYGTSSGGSLDNYGVYGTASNTSGFRAFGVKGEASSTTGQALGGAFDATSSSAIPFGVSGSAYSPSSSIDAYGGYFEATPSGGSGVTYGVYGFAGSVGVYGTALSTGVYGSGYYGVYGNSSSGYGGYFTGGTGAGVVGSGNSYGVYGVSGVSGNAGVYGYNSGNVFTYGVYSSGDARVSRNLTVDGDCYMTGFIFKNGGGFRIDHPTDPANKYLYHSFVESPDMTNLYNGNITLDAKGEATVELPDWFGALNKDFRYQLTAIGAPGPNLYIAEEISRNRFKIAGGTTGMKVSWQVTGIRKDPYAEAHRIPVEEAKSGKERGKYLHPEEYGAPATLGMHYEEEQKMAVEHKQMEEQRAKMEADHKQQEEKRAKMEQERLQIEQMAKPGGQNK